MGCRCTTVRDLTKLVLRYFVDKAAADWRGSPWRICRGTPAAPVRTPPALFTLLGLVCAAQYGRAAHGGAHPITLAYGAARDRIDNQEGVPPPLLASLDGKLSRCADCSSADFFVPTCNGGSRPIIVLIAASNPTIV